MPFLERLATGAERILTLDASGFARELTRIRALPSGEERTTLSRMLLRKWGEEDATAAFAAVAALAALGPEDRAELDQWVAEGWALVDPETAWATATAHWQTAETTMGGSSSARLQARGGPYGAGRMTTIARALAEAGRYEVAAKLIEGSPQDAAGSAAGTIANMWGQIDPEATRQWTLRLAGNTHYNAARQFSRLLLQRDKEEAARYLELTAVHPESRIEMLKSDAELAAERAKMINDIKARAKAK